MSRNIYGSVNDARKAAEHIYGPVNGARKKVIKVYGSVNGARKLMWQEIPRIENVVNGTVTDKDVDALTAFIEGGTYISGYPDLTGYVIHFEVTVGTGVIPITLVTAVIDDGAQQEQFYWPSNHPISDYFNYTVDTSPLTFDLTYVR